MSNQAKTALLKLLLMHCADLRKPLHEKGIACIKLGLQGVDQ